MRTRVLSLFAALLLVAACSTDSDLNGGAQGTGGENQNSAAAGAASNTPAPGTEEQFVVSIGDRVFFNFDQSDLRGEARATLDRQAEWLEQYPQYNVVVEGHCDERGTREYNLALGERRANAVRNYLVAKGVNAARITTISYGKERPEAAGSNESAWAQNRRGVTVLK